MTKTALVVEGGAMRGIFSCGILDEFIAHDFYPFDLCIGVSAGASNSAAYLAKMQGRNLRVYMDYSLRPEFIRYGRFLTGGHLLDLDWMWDVTAQELPIDTDTLFSQQCEFLAAATCSSTGQVHYLKPDAENLFSVLKASSALPIFYRNTVTLDGRQWSDGGVSDAIPVREAYRRGARRILVLRSRHRGYRKTPSKLDFLLPYLLKDVPALVEVMRQRPKAYQASLEFMRTPPGDARIMEVCVPDDFPVSRMTTDKRLLERGYQIGRDTARMILDGWSG